MRMRQPLMQPGPPSIARLYIVPIHEHLAMAANLFFQKMLEGWHKHLEEPLARLAFVTDKNVMLIRHVILKEAQK